MTEGMNRFEEGFTPPPPHTLFLFLRGGFPARLSEHWRSNTYSLHHTNGNQLGGNCSIWPLFSLHHIPSPLCPYILHALTIKMSQRQSIHFIQQAFSTKLNKTLVIYFISPDKKPERRTKDKQEEEERSVWTKLTKAGKGERWIKRGKSLQKLLTAAAICVCSCVRFLSCVWVGDGWSDG